MSMRKPNTWLVLERHFPRALREAAKIMEEGEESHEVPWQDDTWASIESHLDDHYQAYKANDFTEDHLGHLLCRVLMLVELNRLMLPGWREKLEEDPPV